MTGSASVTKTNSKPSAAAPETIQQMAEKSIQDASQYLKYIMNLEVSVIAKAMSMLIDKQHTIEATQAINEMREVTQNAITNFENVGKAAVAVVKDLPEKEPPKKEQKEPEQHTT